MSENARLIQPDRGISTSDHGVPLWLENFIELNKLTYSLEYDTFVHKDPRLLPTKHRECLTTVYLMLIEYGFKVRHKGLLQDAWSNKCAVARTRCVEATKAALLVPPLTSDHKNAANRLLERLVYIMTGKQNQLDIVSMRQFIWSVKKNLAERSNEVSHIMMPVFYGKQDTGKTHIITSLLSSLEGLSVKADFGIFQKEENLQAFEKMYVIFLDEMGKAKDTAIENIKKIMSRGSHLQRQFFEQSTFNKIRSKCTFIAATNRPLSDIVVDDEMRRFWQIEMADYKWINQFWDTEIKPMDWRLLWDCVDLEDREPADEVWPLFKKTQSVYARGNHIEDFVEQHLNIDTNEWHDAIELYRDYQTWCDHQDITKKLTRNNFSSRIKELIPHKHSNGLKFNYSLKTFEERQKVKEDKNKLLSEEEHTGYYVEEVDGQE